MDQSFESLLADAVGGELTEEDKIRFEQIIEGSPELRREYESALATVAALKRMPGPTALRTGDAESLLAEIRASSQLSQEPQKNDESQLDPKQRLDLNPRRHGAPRGFAFRYAASVLIAFTCGYGMHAYLMMQADPPTSAQSVVASVDQTPTVAKSTTLEATMMDAYRRRPRQPALATCMAAMLRGR